MKGLECLNGNFGKFMIRKTKWSNRDMAFYCPCVEGCETTAVDFLLWLRDVTET